MLDNEVRAQMDEELEAWFREGGLFSYEDFSNGQGKHVRFEADVNEGWVKNALNTFAPTLARYVI